MYILFIIVVITSLAVFLVRKRHFDFLTIYFLLLLLYNISTIFGLVYVPSNGTMTYPNEYIYLVSIFPFIFITFFLLLKQPVQNEIKLNEIKYQFRNDNNIIIFSKLLFILFIVVFVYNISTALNSSTKKELLDNNNSLSLVLNAIPALAIMVAYLARRKKMLYFYFFLVVILFFFGGRARLASAVLCLLLLAYYNKPIKIIARKWLIVGGFFGLLLIIAGKRLYGYVLGYGLLEGVSRWYTDFDSSFLLTGSEFVTNTAILNAVMEKDFSISWQDIFTSLFSILPIPVSLFGFNSGIFNERFQNTLFSDIEYGMAYSIWAEGYSWLGLLGIIMFSFIIPLSLFKLWNLYNKYANTIYGPLLILIGFTIAFWCHRNSVGTILANIRNLLYPTLILIFCVSFINKFIRK